MPIPRIDATVGNTPLVELQRLNPNPDNKILLKLEGNNPAGSVKDRPALNMIRKAEQEGRLKKGERLIEATSGNTGIALAMVAAMKGYAITLIMPDNLSFERRVAMSVYGADLILVSEEEGMEGARDLALSMEQHGKGMVLNQFANPNNPEAHYLTTGPEIWRQSEQKITHLVSSMGTTGTIMGLSRYFKEQNPDIQIIGCQPTENSSIPGIRRWPKEYLPDIFEPERVDRVIDIDQEDAENMAREMASVEGVFCGISSGGALVAARQVSAENNHAVIVSIVCDRGDRYISTGIFK